MANPDNVGGDRPGILTPILFGIIAVWVVCWAFVKGKGK